jgi:perosamine synthetase
MEYVADAVASGWVSSLGKYIEAFEKAFATFCGSTYALAVSNGTTALHLALVSMGIRATDEIIIPDLTFVATANAVSFTGARVVPVDIEADTLCIDCDAIRKAITKHTRLIMPVHLYGHPAKMDEICEIAREHNLLVLEDAAEAHGAKYLGRPVGSLGDCGVFSFYGNKIITSGEGGMLTTNSKQLHDRAKLLRDHAMGSERRYWHTEVGYNYRMTNLQAALGLAQLERIDAILEHRRQLMGWYREELRNVSRVRLNNEPAGSRNVYWMICLEIPGMDYPQRDRLIGLLKEHGVDSRPYFYPVSELPMYERAITPIAHAASASGINLPTYFDLTKADVAVIARAVREAITQLAD